MRHSGWSEHRIARGGARVAPAGGGSSGGENFRHQTAPSLGGAMAARIQDVHRDEPPCGDSVPGKQGRGLEIEREGRQQIKEREREREGERGPRSTTREGRKATDPPIQAMKKNAERARGVERDEPRERFTYYQILSLDSRVCFRMACFNADALESPCCYPWSSPIHFQH